MRKEGSLKSLSNQPFVQTEALERSSCRFIQKDTMIIRIDTLTLEGGTVPFILTI